MTLSRREEILSKDILLIKDVQELNDMSYQSAAKLIRDIKRVMKSQFQVSGRVATRDYLNFFEGKIPVAEVKAERVETVKRKYKDKPKEAPPFRFKDYQGAPQ